MYSTISVYVGHVTPSPRHIPWDKPCSPLYRPCSWSSYRPA